jgi:hypothetical protein
MRFAGKRDGSAWVLLRWYYEGTSSHGYCTNLRLASESPLLLVQARRIAAFGDRTPVPVVLANLDSDQYSITLGHWPILQRYWQGTGSATGTSSTVVTRGSKHTWLGIQRRRKRRALVRMESLAG